MRLAASNIDAVYLYRSGLGDQAAQRDFIPIPESFVPSISLNEAVNLRDVYKLSIPIHCLVPQAKARRQSSLLRCSVISSKAPYESFLPLGQDSFLASPELCIFTLRQDLTIAELALLICEFCGGYSLPLSSSENYREHLPLSSISSMQEFACNATYVKGAANMRAASALAFDDSNSPMESALTLLLTLPPSLGGYGLSRPQLNEAVCGYRGSRPPSFVRTGKPLHGVRYGDLVYDDAKLVVEYLSKEHHEGRWDSDALRNNELKAAGFDVFAVTPAQVYNTQEMDKVANHISQRLGESLPNLSPVWRGRNMQLREYLGL